jgi:AraC-like DNA-binding protein
MRVSLLLPPGQLGQIMHVTGNPRPYDAHTHDELEFNLVISGTAAYVVRGHRYPLRPRSLFWLHPEQEHVLVDTSPDLDLWVVAVDAGRLQRLLPGVLPDPLLARDHPGHPLHPLAGSASDRLARLVAEVDRGREPVNAFNAGLAVITQFAWRMTAEGDAGSPLHPAVEAAAQLLTRRDAPADLTALARWAGLSPARLSHTFARQMGATIGAYRNRCRLERALARHDDRHGTTWLEAALWAGFGSYDQFHRTYRTVYGRSPRTAGR